jgi:hypothetical protein
VRAKVIPKREVRDAAEAVAACVLGQMMHAKILNEPGMLRDLERLVMQQLGVNPLTKKTAHPACESSIVRSPRKQKAAA